MPGNADNIRVWDVGDVYIFDPAVPFVSATHLPADIDADLHASWIPAGLMLGDPGVEFPRDIEKTEINSWQQKRVRTKHKNGKVDANFSLLEDNEVTEELIDAENVPTAKARRLAFIFSDDDTGYTERRFTTVAADCWVTNDNHPEDPSGDARPVEASIYPDATGKLFTIQKGIPT